MRLFAAFLILACSLVAAAQTTDTATLQGTVTDQTNAAVPHADVTVENSLTGLRRQATTDANGSFVLAGLPIAGEYQVTVSSAGFASAHVDHVMLAAGSAAHVAVSLNVAAASASVSVAGAANDVRIDQPQLGIRLSEQQIEETPLLSRRITYLPLLNAANRPAINQGDVFMNEDLFTTNGAGRRQTWFEVDGSTGNDSWGRQTHLHQYPADGRR